MGGHRRNIPRVVWLLAGLVCLAWPGRSGLPSGGPSTAIAADGPARIGPLLARALGDPADVMRRADGTFAVWVHFADRGLSPGGRAVALAAREQELPSRTLARRAKMRAAGEPLVDAADLPVADRYLAAVAATGASPRRVSRWLNAASYQATDAQLAEIAGLPFVRRVELVARLRRLPVEPTEMEKALADRAREAALAEHAGAWTIDYGYSLPELAQINVPPVHELGYFGQGVIIGLLDSGWRLTHDALAGIEVLAAYDFINDNEVVDNEPGEISNQYHHGTITLSTAMGYLEGGLVGPAFGASAILAKTEDVSQEVPIEEDWWVAGLEWVEALGADVVSSSLGYYDWYTFEDLDGATAVTTVAADLAVDRGVVVVNSAGNARNGFGHIIAPADGFGVIATGAVALDGSVAWFSSPGPSYDGRIKPDVAALGVSNHVVSVHNDTSYARASGTSLSCPLVAGVAALVLSRVPGLTPLQVRAALRETANRAHAPDNDYGWGVIDAFAAVTYWGALIAHTPLTDTSDTTGPYLVAAELSGRLPVDPSRTAVIWRANDGPWLSEPLTPVGGDVWQAQLPGQTSGTTVDYYLEVVDTADIAMRHPAAGDAAPHSFLVEGPTQVVPPAVTRLVGNAPNPFNPLTVIVFDLARAGPARLEIFDLRGRLVRPLVVEDLPAGRHQASWDGLGAGGLEVAAGVYLARLVAGGEAHRHKLTLVR